MEQDTLPSESQAVFPGTCRLVEKPASPATPFEIRRLERAVFIAERWLLCGCVLSTVLCVLLVASASCSPALLTDCLPRAVSLSTASRTMNARHGAEQWCQEGEMTAITRVASQR